ncbi:MarR family transcriptional regulator [Siccirubricoccus deserti]
MHEAVRVAGFTDLQDPHLSVFSYPLPDGVRPSALAHRIGMSRQATNYLITQMEALGYLERRATEGAANGASSISPNGAGRWAR